jgi:hypothetical protein
MIYRTYTPALRLPPIIVVALFVWQLRMPCWSLGGCFEGYRQRHSLGTLSQSQHPQHQRPKRCQKPPLFDEGGQKTDVMLNTTY